MRISDVLWTLVYVALLAFSLGMFWGAPGAWIGVGAGLVLGIGTALHDRQEADR
jgi:hypothetical protein